MEIPLEVRSDRQFVSLLSPIYLNGLENHPHSVYGLSRDFTLAYMNPAWFNFAAMNDGPRVLSDWPVGRCVLDAVSDNLREWHRSFFAAAFAESVQIPKHHEYECSSPEMLRQFVMVAYPVIQSGDGLVVVNSLRLELAHEQAGRQCLPPSAKVYTDGVGLIHQCMHCRRFQSMVNQTRWDWVSDWVRKAQQNVSHALCPQCFEHYYPD